MSTQQEIYIGSYLRVWLPTIQQTTRIGRCPVCDNKTGTAYCPYDGARIISEEFEQAKPGIWSLCADVFDDEDRFFSPASDDKYTLILANDHHIPGFVYIDEESDTNEYHLPERNFGGDWDTLIEYLDKNRLKYTRHFGIVTYWI